MTLADKLKFAFSFSPRHGCPIGIGPDGRDRRNQLATLMFTLIKGGESDPKVLRAKGSPVELPAAGLFHQIA